MRWLPRITAAAVAAAAVAVAAAAALLTTPALADPSPDAAPFAVDAPTGTEQASVTVIAFEPEPVLTITAFVLPAGTPIKPQQTSPANPRRLTFVIPDPATKTLAVLGTMGDHLWREDVVLRPPARVKPSVASWDVKVRGTELVNGATIPATTCQRTTPTTVVVAADGRSGTLTLQCAADKTSLRITGTHGLAPGHTYKGSMKLDDSTSLSLSAGVWAQRRWFWLVFGVFAVLGYVIAEYRGSWRRYRIVSDQLRGIEASIAGAVSDFQRITTLPADPSATWRSQVHLLAGRLRQVRRQHRFDLETVDAPLRAEIDALDAVIAGWPSTADEVKAVRLHATLDTRMWFPKICTSLDELCATTTLTASNVAAFVALKPAQWESLSNAATKLTELTLAIKALDEREPKVPADRLSKAREDLATLHSKVVAATEPAAAITVYEASVHDLDGKIDTLLKEFPVGRPMKDIDANYRERPVEKDSTPTSTPKRHVVRFVLDVASLVVALFAALCTAWLTLYAKAPFGTLSDYLTTATAALGAGFLSDNVKNAVTGFSFTSVKDFVTKRGA